MNKSILLVFSLFLTISQCQIIYPIENIKIVTFDLFAALVDLTPAMQYQTLYILRDWNDTELIKQFTNIYIGQYNQKNMDNAKQSETQSKFNYMINNGLDYALSKVGKTVTSEIREQLLHIWCNLDTYPEAHYTLGILKNRGYQIAILSNGDFACLSEEGNFIGGPEFFDTYFSSQVSIHNPDFKEDQFKTHEHIYAQTWTSQLVHFNKEEVLHVNGGKSDGMGAASYKINSVWHNRLHQIVYPYKGDVIYDLRELLDILPDKHNAKN